MEDATPTQPIDEPLKVALSTTAVAVDAAFLNRLWDESEARAWGLARSDFERIVMTAGLRQNFGLAAGIIAGREEQAAFFRGVKVADLVLASACAEGNERAWEHFMAAYGGQLTRAAIAISGSATVGRDLADAFYAELYGLRTQDGKRKCPLESYRGRGSLMGWLRTTLSQKFVDHYRRTFREETLDDERHDLPVAAGSSLSPESETGEMLRDAIQEVLSSQPAEEQFVLAAYYLDERTLAEIGKVLHVHEATISRKLKRATEGVRKELLKKLEKGGLSRRAAQEALGTDPRDLELGSDLKKLLQRSASESFLGREPADAAMQSRSSGGAMPSRATGLQAGEADRD